MYAEFWRFVCELFHVHALKAVDDSHHGHICHMGVAFSVNDLCNQIVLKHPDITTPSIEWICCQF